MKYQIKITYPDGLVTRLIHKDRMSWCLRSAKKHLHEFVLKHGLKAELEPS